MEERFGSSDVTYVDTQFGQFEYVQWSGKNESGMIALCDRIVVLPDQASALVGSIIIPDQIKDHVGQAATTGVMVSAGPQAFAYDRDRLVKWEGERPKPGTRIFFEKYAGQEYIGLDGNMYRVMSDRSVGAMVAPIEAEAVE